MMSVGKSNYWMLQASSSLISTWQPGEDEGLQEFLDHLASGSTLHGDRQSEGQNAPSQSRPESAATSEIPLPAFDSQLGVAPECQIEQQAQVSLPLLIDSDVSLSTDDAHQWPTKV